LFLTLIFPPHVKNKIWARKRIAYHIWARHVWRFALSVFLGFTGLVNIFLQDISFLYAYCVHFASYNILNSPCKKSTWIIDTVPGEKV